VNTKRDPLEVLQHHIDRRGLKLTRQRRLIAEVFFDAGGHVAADQVWDRVRHTDPNVSLATVYRTMKLLTECGLAAPHRFDGTSVRYEPAAEEEEHHDHLICVKCGRIVEFVNESIEALQERVAREAGFVVHHHRMELYGECAGCRTRAEAQGLATST
jgi:Fur family ferric uptake transcriptional regulator